nr:hypothetical protein [uncultured Roseateles sp.]
MTRVFTQEQLAIRRPLWEALSEMFLDTELQDGDYKFIARRVLESSLNPQELSIALWCDVFPVLAHNLQSVAGEWAGFDASWLAERIQENAQSNRAGPIASGLITGADVEEIISAAWVRVAAHLPGEFLHVARAT